MRTFREILAKGEDGALHLGPERARVYSDLSPEDKERGQGNNTKGTSAASYGGAQNRVGNDDESDAFDYDVNEAPTTQTMFMANLSFADPVYDEAGSLYDSDILSEVHDHDNYQDAVCEHHEVHEMHDDVQPNCVVISDVEYTCDSNTILYDRYVKDNAKPAVQNNVSSVPNDAYMMIINEMHEQPVQCISMKAHTKVVDASLTVELTTYKE
uniref:Integrase, catalytic region, zinc finger, CCHC-type, peptidase aspartic, catalytic n=1 Tax=Tanacetum cinerariifolium TaxID=118510 RepID=A0A6L2LCF1_TANCI|nr:hypothetical protein [Tanacetum cinerariifolium]